jgi:pyruvate/2-oxoglutarate/acetoin dehydrogenase E1 component
MTDTETPSGTRTVSLGEACNLALDQALESDPRVFLIGEDITDRSGGSFKVTKGLTKKYGSDRVRDTPIAEQAIVGAAIGASLGGMRPVAEIMIMDFACVAMDQIVNRRAAFAIARGFLRPRSWSQGRVSSDARRCEGPPGVVHRRR